MISRFAKVLATGLPHTINATGSLPTITITAKEFRLAESRLIFGTEKRRGRSLPACEEYVEDNPRLQVSCSVAQMFESGSFLWLFRLNLLRQLSP